MKIGLLFRLTSQSEEKPKNWMCRSDWKTLGLGWYIATLICCFNSQFTSWNLQILAFYDEIFERNGAKFVNIRTILSPIGKGSGSSHAEKADKFCQKLRVFESFARDKEFNAKCLKNGTKYETKCSLGYLLSNFEHWIAKLRLWQKNWWTVFEYLWNLLID